MKLISLLGTSAFYLIISAAFFLLGQRKVFYELAAGLVLSYVVIIVIRLLYPKDRPIKKDYKNFIEKIDVSSFPSMHSCRAAMLFFLISYNFRNFLLFISLAALAILVSWSRYYLKKHYLPDIVAGFLLGIILSFVVIL
jgi:undecaprenyl-diphosphatase